MQLLLSKRIGNTRPRAAFLVRFNRNPVYNRRISREHSVTNEEHIPDVWDGLSVFFWSLIFLTGLVPDSIFLLFRNLGQVAIRQAFTNSSWFITFACAGFLAWFVCQRSREAGDRGDIAFGKGVQICVLALTAFLPLPMELLSMYPHIPFAGVRFVILATFSIKMLCWLYLFQLILRYHLFLGDTVFRMMPLLFPSAWREKKKTAADTYPPANEEPGESPADTDNLPPTNNNPL